MLRALCAQLFVHLACQITVYDVLAHCVTIVRADKGFVGDC